jgi:hypothetical protein
VKEQVLDEGQRTLDEQQYEVNDHAAPICGFRFEVLVRSRLCPVFPKSVDFNVWRRGIRYRVALGEGIGRPQAHRPTPLDVNTRHLCLGVGSAERHCEPEHG